LAKKPKKPAKKPGQIYFLLILMILETMNMESYKRESRSISQRRIETAFSYLSL
jgi:hypothetical protein